MTIKSKKEHREILLKALQKWHHDLGIKDFPKRFGISTNEKKFREISFRTKKNIPEDQATVEDIVVNNVPVYGMDHNIVGYVITYRVWLPFLRGKFPGYINVRFSLNLGLVALIKIGKFFIAVEHDSIPLQEKTIGTARMYGVSEDSDLEKLGQLILEKEYPFLIDHLKSFKSTQLGETVFQDPSTRYEETLYLLLELELNKEINSKEELSGYLDHRNEEMLLYHIYSEEELKEILDRQMARKESETVVKDEGLIFRDQYSLWALASYFYSKS